jgi:hypothetical protein
MEVVEWIIYVDKIIKKYKEKDITVNPLPNIFTTLEQYEFFVSDELDLIPIVKYIYSKIYAKYSDLHKDFLKLYILCTYFLCMKFYSDSYLSFPINAISEVFEGKYDTDDILLVEIDILKIIDYKFPLFPVE